MVATLEQKEHWTVKDVAKFLNRSEKYVRMKMWEWRDREWIQVRQYNGDGMYFFLPEEIKYMRAEHWVIN